jgi:biofilm protein TabA
MATETARKRPVRLPGRPDRLRDRPRTTNPAWRAGVRGAVECYHPSMIIDTLANCGRYRSLHAEFARAFEFLAQADWAELASGSVNPERHSVRHAIDGDRMYVSIDHTDGRGRDGARLEAHRRHIDIQFTIEGHEEIGWKPLAACGQPDGAFDDERDVGFFGDSAETWLSLPAGTFAIFFPDDAHAPLGGHGPVKKAIVKIAIEASTTQRTTAQRRDQAPPQVCASVSFPPPSD